MGSPSLGTGLPRLSPAMWHPDSADGVLTWETGLVGPRFPQLPPLITALLSFCIVFTAVRLLLLSQGTDRLTPNHRAENNTQAKETVHKTWFLLVGLGWGGSREMEKMQTLNPFNDRSNKNFYSERDKIVLRIKIICVKDWLFQLEIIFACKNNIRNIKILSRPDHKIPSNPQYMQLYSPTWSVSREKAET